MDLAVSLNYFLLMLFKVKLVTELIDFFFKDAFATVSAVESFKAINSNYMPLYNVQELIGKNLRRIFVDKHN